MRKFSFPFVIGVILLASIVGGIAGERYAPMFASNRASRAAALSAPADASPNGASINSIEGDYHDAVQVVEANYTGEIDYAKANQAAIQGMLMTLDPHSAFFPVDDFRKLKEDQDSMFYGIGVTILRHRDGVYVQSPVAGTPAARAGLRFGDRIVEVDGKDAREWSSAEVSKNVRGALGSQVTLKLERAGEEAPVYRTITRDSVVAPSIPLAFMARPDTGYIGLTAGFQRTTEEELKKSLAGLQKQGARQIVLDLRNNPGGLLDESISVAGQFLPYNAPVVSVRGRAGEAPKVYRNRVSETTDVPLVVLINRGSASASEIVAGAMQDYGRAMVVGETSFGKGLVQRVFQLPYGNGLTLTTAKYYTPYGRLIQREYASGSFYDYYVRHTNQAANANAPAPLSTTPQPNASTAAPTPTPAPTPTGTPIRTAGGRVFYGGGGITPDVEVKPQDFSGAARGRIFEAAFFFVRNLVAGKVAGLDSYRFDAQPANLDLTNTTNRSVRVAPLNFNEEMQTAFRRFVEQDETLKLTPKQFESENDFIRTRLQAEYATATQGSDAATRVLLENDLQLQKAFEVFPQARQLADSVRAQVVIG